MSQKCHNCIKKKDAPIELTDKYVKNACKRYYNKPIRSLDSKKTVKICEYLNVNLISSKKDSKKEISKRASIQELEELIIKRLAPTSTFSSKPKRKSSIPIRIPVHIAERTKRSLDSQSTKESDKESTDNFYETTHRNSASPSLDFNPCKIYNLGEDGSGFDNIKEVQDFYVLHKHWLEVLQANNEYFEDTVFLTNDISLHGAEKVKTAAKNNSKLPSYTWLRPNEIVQNPIFVDDFQSTHFELKQGALGDCWFLAAVAALTQVKRLFNQVVPENQSFSEDYAGIFHFRFWQFGRWIDVVIDDKLPTTNKNLVYAKTTSNNSFFFPLLEKAFAKLNGSYNAIVSGFAIDAMVDLTGGIGERLFIARQRHWLSIVKEAFQKGSLVVCSNMLNVADKKNATIIKDLRHVKIFLPNHAYTVTGIKSIQQNNNTINLFRLRNPWGHHEWTGDWSDKSSKWNGVVDEEKRRLSFEKRDDGEFWIASYDIEKYATYMEICNLNPNVFITMKDTTQPNRYWEVTLHEGKWIPGITSGGWHGEKSFESNPQYLLTVEAENAKRTCKVIINLMQKSTIGNRIYKTQQAGYVIYKLEDVTSLPKPLNEDFFKLHKHVHLNSTLNSRDTTSRLDLSPGTFCIIPMIKDKRMEDHYVLRIFSERKLQLQKYDADVSYRMTSYRATTIMNDYNTKIFDKFKTIAGAKNEINWEQLKNLLDETITNKLYKGFSKDVCRSLVATIDTGNTGKVAALEFKALWIEIHEWMDIFVVFDTDKNFILDSFESRRAFQAMGFKLNNRTLVNIMNRYGNPQEQGMEFNQFLICSIKLRSMIDKFNKQANGKELAEFTKKEWIYTILYS